MGCNCDMATFTPDAATEKSPAVGLHNARGLRNVHD
jgi:hypothetical protein